MCSDHTWINACTEPYITYGTTQWYWISHIIMNITPSFSVTIAKLSPLLKYS